MHQSDTEPGTRLSEARPRAGRHSYQQPAVEGGDALMSNEPAEPTVFDSVDHWYSETLLRVRRGPVTTELSLAHAYQNRDQIPGGIVDCDYG